MAHTHHEADAPAYDPVAMFPAAKLAQGDVPPIEHGRDMNMSLIITLCVAGAMLIFITITLTQAWFLHVQAQDRELKSYKQVNHPLVDLQQKQQANLSGYRWMDGEKRQVVAIPIDRAMELTVDRYRKQTAGQ